MRTSDIAYVRTLSQPCARRQPRGQQLSYLKRPRVLLTFGLNLFWVAGYATLYSYITPFLQEATSLDAAALSAVLLAFGASTLVGNKLGGWLCDKFGMRPVVLTALAVQAALLVTLFALGGPLWLVVAAVLVWGVFSWVPSPIINLAVVQAAPEAAVADYVRSHPFGQGAVIEQDQVVFDDERPS